MLNQKYKTLFWKNYIFYYFYRNHFQVFTLLYYIHLPMNLYSNEEYFAEIFNYLLTQTLGKLFITL